MFVRELKLIWNFRSECQSDECQRDLPKLTMTKFSKAKQIEEKLLERNKETKWLCDLGESHDQKTEADQQMLNQAHPNSGIVTMIAYII